MSVNVQSGAASFAACLRLFSSYPIAVARSPADGPEQSMLLRHRAGGSAGCGPSYFVLSQEQASDFLLGPWDGWRGWGCWEGAGQPIRPAIAVPAAAHEVIAYGMPIPRDGALLGWVTDRQASAMLSVYHARGGPQVRVLPLAGSDPLDWPPFAASPLDDGQFWEYVARGQLVDLTPLLARHPGRAFWVPSRNRDRAAAAHGCVVLRESLAADEYWLAGGVYLDHWILREATAVATADYLLSLPGAVDLASRLPAISRPGW